VQFARAYLCHHASKSVASPVCERAFACAQKCAGDTTNPYSGYSDWLPKWNDELIRQHYAKYCGLPFGIPLWVKHSTMACARACMRPCVSVRVHRRQRTRTHSPSAAISHTHTAFPWVCERSRPKLCAHAHSLTLFHICTRNQAL
jgi:hypothetical protein